MLVMSIQVKSIDEFGILERLRKSKDPNDKEVLEYVKALKEALERQRDITKMALAQLREVSKK